MCAHCWKFLNFVVYKKAIDNYGWRCMHSKCRGYKKYKSIRQSSFFQGLNTDFKTCFRIIEKFISKIFFVEICNAITLICNRTIFKVMKKIKSLILEPNFTHNKFGGICKFVQIDETMLNYKYKLHHRKSLDNCTDAFVIMEVGIKTTKMFVKIIPGNDHVI